MKTPGFQWYVAWRYLMERPRRLSPSILAVTAFLSWGLIAAGATALLHPFTDSIYFGGRSVPEWVTAATGCSVALIPTFLFGELIRLGAFARGRRLSRVAVVMVAIGAVATLAMLGVGYWFRREAGLFPNWFIAFALILIAQMPITMAMLLHRGEPWWESDSPLLSGPLWLPPASLSDVDRMLVHRSLAAARSWALLGALGRGMLRLGGRMAARFRAVRLVAIGINLFVGTALLALAVYGVIHVVIPRLDVSVPVWAAAAGGGVAAIGLLLFVVGAARGRAWQVDVAGAAVALGLAGVAIVTYAAVGAEAYTGVMRFGGSINLPMWLVIAGGICLALVPMSLVMAAIRYFFTFFTSVSVGGVALGVTALVIVLSVMSGFETDLRKKILGSNAHILITKEDSAGGNFAEYSAIMDRLSRVDGVVAQTPYVISEVVIAANSNYANVIIKGIDPRTVGDVTDLDENVEEKKALERLWPLADDGGVLGPPDAGTGAGVEPAPDAAPAPKGDVVDPAPGDFELGGGAPVDLSGGETEAPPEPEPEPEPGQPVRPRDVLDPAPDDLVVTGDEPIDLSGGELGDDDAGPEEEEDDDDDAGPRDAGVFDGDGGIEIAPILEGIDDPFERGEVIEPHIPPRIARLSGVLAGRELVKQLNLYDGQEVKVISPLGENTPAGPVPRTKLFRIAGTFFTGMYEYDLKFIYVELTALQDFLDIGDEVRGIEIRVRDPEQTDEVMERMMALFPPFGATVGTPVGPFAEAAELIRKGVGPHYRIQDWKELNRSLFSALKLEKIAMFLVLAIIILVASFSIVGNLIMVVVEKAKEIAVLKTLGASDGGIMYLFIVQGFFIGVVGTVIGLVLGLGACWGNIRFGIPINPEVYYIDRLPMHVEYSSVVLVAAAGIVISVIATVYPAFTGARIEPVKGLRYE